jgi:hypothetical protein
MEADEEYDDLFDDDLFHHPPFTQVCSIRCCCGSVFKNKPKAVLAAMVVMEFGKYYF